MTGVTIVNFSHPLTDAQRAGIEQELDGEITRVIDVPTHFDAQQPFAAQALDLIAATGLTPTDWQSLPILVNPPSLAAIAAVVLAQLHGLMGHFPAIVRIRPVPGSVPPAFEFAEIIDLNTLRIRAAGRTPAVRESPVQRAGSSTGPKPSALHRGWRWVQSLRWKQAVQLLSAAIIFTLVGDIVFQIMTWEWWELSGRQKAWRAILVVLAVPVAAGLVDELVGIFRRRRQLQVGPISGLSPAPALIVIASASRNADVGPHWTAVRHFIGERPTALKYVFIIHSANEQSKASATALYSWIDRYTEVSVEPIMEGLEANDFDDPMEVTDICLKAVGMAVAAVGAPSKVVLDATGGTAMASIGAAVAKARNEGITLGYIPNQPTGDFGTKVRRVDMTWDILPDGDGHGASTSEGTS